MLRFKLYCENTSAHALKAVVNVRDMLEITASLTLLACKYTNKNKKFKKNIKHILWKNPAIN